MRGRRQVTVFIPAPPVERPWLATNRRDHHYARAKLVKLWRGRAFAEARATYARPLTSPVAVHVVMHWPDHRRRDLDGGAPTAKACLDGIQDAGLIAGDDHRHVTRLTFTADPGSDEPGVTITITEETRDD